MTGLNKCRGWGASVLFALLSVSIGWAEPINFAHGRVLEDITCRRDTTQSYALYIPTSLNYTRPTAVIFCVDPDGRGTLAVQRFAPAAEKFGYLVVGSNHAARGRWGKNSGPIDVLWRDVKRRFLLDPRRTYVAGFAGSMPVAYELARRRMARGVVSVAGAYERGELPDGIAYPVFAVGAALDPCYLELRATQRELERRGVIHRIAWHAGARDWLPEAVAHEALGWLNVQAMRLGTMAADAKWLAAEFESRFARVPAEPAHERLRAIRGLIQDFKGFADVARWEQEAVELARSPQANEAAKEDLVAERNEEALVHGLRMAVRDGFASGVKKMSAELHEQAAPDAGAAYRARATRVLERVYGECGDVVRAAMREQDYAKAATWLEMMTLVLPGRPQAHFDLAQCEAARGNKRAALASLQRAEAVGFRDVERLENEEAFHVLRLEPAFLELVSRIRESRAAGTDRTEGRTTTPGA